MVLVLLLFVAAAGVLADDALGGPARERSARAFQQLVRGVGLGPAVDLTAGAFDFDPRLAGHSSLDAKPLPLGSAGRTRPVLSVFPLRRVAGMNRDGRSL